MVLGKAGMRLEAYKFGLYISVPILASVIFNEPEVQRRCADYFQFLKYPANPNTNLRQEFEELRKQRDEERERRAKYAEEVRRMQDSARRSREGREAALLQDAAAADEGRGSSQQGLRRWWPWGRSRSIHVTEAAAANDSKGASSAQ